VAKPFIHYQEKNGNQYASIYVPRWENGHKVNDITNLGRVINKEDGIFKSRARGIFKYNLVNGYSDVLDDNYDVIKDFKSTLIFGDVYIAYNILNSLGYIELIKKIFGEFAETTIALVLHRLLTDRPNVDANFWYNGTFIKILCPNAKLDSRRISEYLAKIGSQKFHDTFFTQYLNNLYTKDKSCSILIDSTGLQNDIKIQYTQISNHNGQINNEARLIYVIDRKTKMPIYYRLIAGNIIDVSTLKKILDDLKLYDIDVNFAILDAGYYSEDNIKQLFANKINFITRLIGNRLIYKELVASNYDKIIHIKNKNIHAGRLIHVLKQKFNLFGHTMYAYISIDHKRMYEEVLRLGLNSVNAKNTSIEELETERKTAGLFIIISSIDIDINEILPFYYQRQTIEQIFDVSKNHVSLLPVRCHNLETFNGHLLISFIATITYLVINNKFNHIQYNALNIFSIFHYLFCDIKGDTISIHELNKDMKEIMKMLNISVSDLPSKMPDKQN
jgi:transposase